MLFREIRSMYAIILNKRVSLPLNIIKFEEHHIGLNKCLIAFTENRFKEANC